MYSSPLYYFNSTHLSNTNQSLPYIYKLCSCKEAGFKLPADVAGEVHTPCPQRFPGRHGFCHLSLSVDPVDDSLLLTSSSPQNTKKRLRLAWSTGVSVSPPKEASSENGQPEARDPQPLPLSDVHRAMLMKESAITEDIIRERGYRTTNDPTETGGGDA